MTLLNRRTFVKSTLATGIAAATGIGSYIEAFGASKNINADGKIKDIGLQLYTVRSLMRENLEKTIADVAKVGYSQVEFAGYYDRTATEIKSILDQNGLSSPSTHVDIELVQGDNLKRTIEYSNTVGHQYVIVPFLQPEDRQTLDQYKKITESFNRIGEECNKAGLKFAYHNHDFELKAIDGVVPLDILLQESDPDLFNIEMDLFWVIAGDGNPIDYFKKYPGRFPLCHVKDRTGDGQMVDVGQGVVDFTSMFALSELAGLEYFIVEHDQPENPLNSIKNSYKTLRNMKIG
ncbi:MAG: sugar phosphate isomerase/epimerase [Alphaproteobacteria bacterium]|nr:sugar phosphate isomerase/epimerase [Alphaproteobacteria bacterium]HPF46467.1 sugar phosphate isomerase/epimerase [Emcibacteraceae bacterium]HRW30785.1 sugar phosphate isomerase/epimerase [Emcibacteraceae bacterium]